MKKIIITAVILVSALFAKAQQDAMFTHYMFNTLSVNPAYAGSRGAMTFNALHRSQWVGFEGAPVTQTFTMHTPMFNQNLGLGLSVLNDKIGPTNTTSFNLDLAYHLRLGAKARLSFGLKGGVSLWKGNFTDLNLDNKNDASFSNNINKTLPNVGFGMYYYQERFYIGVSSPKIMENKIEASAINVTEARHYFLIAGGVIDLNQSGSVQLKPTGFLKVTEAAPIEGDVTATFLFRNKFWLGAMYRTGDAYGALIGINLTPQFALGYSFDYSTTNTTFRYNSGSHEVMLQYDLFFKDKSKIKSPRYF